MPALIFAGDRVVVVVIVVFVLEGARFEPCGRYSTNVYKGRLRPEVQPITLVYTIFHEKGTPSFVHLLLTSGTLFTYLVQNFASLLTAVYALSFK